ncbi:hypothetical protein F4808DRAFT_406420 [Astrocystis sublimbata]|nr:hypothetical protein F4808DRAFT_406420 [Astrocystis sublimbata]
MATIKPIEAKTIHQIQSGQVIVDLCSVVKELVENSLDAGASNIEVRFKNQGLDAIEVQDNGSGISRENYATLALKHYTSKLSSYSDLESLETFGFRGEALSSLCALSKFSVTTCLASDAPKGSRLDFETSGRLLGTSVVAAQKGTTIVVEGLFYNLPVRRRELERNIKREWNKVLGVLNQYACIQTGLKFSVSQQPNKGKRMVLFSTKGNLTTRENIVNVFGAKTLSVLIPLDLEFELESTSLSSQRPTPRSESQVKIIRVRGHVSRPAYGEGRQTPDRQMFFVNGRPCGLPQFAKVFNEVYKSYNASQSPFIFADIQLDTHLYDVNVSPDKRSILLHDQTRMLDNLRESLGTLFESQDYALPTSHIQTPKQSLLKRPSRERHATPSTEAPAKNLESTNTDDCTTPSSIDAESTSELDTIRTEDEHSALAARNNGLISRWVERNAGLREKPRLEGGKGRSIDEADTTARANTRSPLSPDLKQLESPSSEGSIKDDNRTQSLRAQHEEQKHINNDAIANKSIPPKSVVSEPPIPSVSPLPRTSDMNSKKSFPLSMAKRPAPEIATITIGDHTVTSVIGSTPKKPRLEHQQNRNHSRSKSAKVPVPTPSFNGRLTQMFAAQSKPSKSDQREVKEVEEDQQDSDLSEEHLFVSDDSAEESETEHTFNISSLHGNQQHSSQASQAPQASEASLEEDWEAEPESSAHLPNAGDGDDKTDETAEENITGETHDSNETAEKNTSEESQKRTQSFVKGNTRKKDATYHLQQSLQTNERLIRDSLTWQQERISGSHFSTKCMPETERLDADDAEEKLSLTISKSDFEKMKIIGQFNLGFILATRAAETSSADTLGRDDELFIIDQHATDEKYNFERLQASTVVQSQRLVHPKTLELTAVEEDIVSQNLKALETNGFMVSYDECGDEPVGTRCQLLSLPLSRETTFSLADLEELISLLQDHQSASTKTVPRPSKVRKMFAMRACRSSVMIGKSLSVKQMEKLVRHMGELDKPWNCPHGRPTMRHLCGLGAWDGLGWREGDDSEGKRASLMDWGAYLDERRNSEQQ